ncbi:DNA polymerase subunit gamma-2, mitochondrial-like isoform X1 [Amphibalanus amphitrite]|uniref:DNA polymerase subunit gamma-2, mitochondrial-like isoform X1 n=2 Tax=Amphibalanus amphitrite TaxID=1232801 RepID=UPI001C91B475|nr:DNA polymerase subunit gamma-2, mitochondrial-like isoform X1 [Amphibalanus amphitrite]XP_043191994.1 DNA polymerase subunit gamma-2, mitochondrial-like isoform X1 [Amphibalanus amphitrite]XP_043191995.1 DNA polymerase subunit gamma-2, mitochondrial-like isoform X1 [Amphibalanus amphitrite]
MPVGWDILLRHLSHHSYLSCAPGPGALPTLGPLGRLLLRNLTVLWRRDVELGLNVPVVPAVLSSRRMGDPAQSLTDSLAALHAAQGSLHLTLPFGVTLERPGAGPLTPPEQLEATPPPADAPPTAGGQLSLVLAVPPPDGADWHQTLQRRRRIWWRDLADDPGNYSLAQSSPDDAQVLFDGRLPVERLRSHGPQAIEGAGGTQEAHVFSCELCLQSALYSVCGDALDAGALRLQERLAPYRRAVPSRHDWPEELRALALHISNQLRSSGVSVFPLPEEMPAEGEEDQSNSEEAQRDGERTNASSTVEEPWLAAPLRSSDGAGVPLTVLLSERTLQDGVCRLRSRDTSLSHQVHVSQITDGG